MTLIEDAERLQKRANNRLRLVAAGYMAHMKQTEIADALSGPTGRKVTRQLVYKLVKRAEKKGLLASDSSPS
jgi:DNA-binding transcriptional regulator LsrR (DeoR family)